jgi:hypothetical protein
MKCATTCGRKCHLDRPDPPLGLCYCGNPRCIISILNRQRYERDYGDYRWFRSDYEKYGKAYYADSRMYGT